MEDNNHSEYVILSKTTHEIGMENSVLKCNTFARTGGSATCIKGDNYALDRKVPGTCLKNSFESIYFKLL